ncbi:hypothetical protein LPJ60_001395 [Coemansia sp. RSA 2675]|nr:hypothetical protein LPJ60_001395 [Coemansia sp. RSA 2675]
MSSSISESISSTLSSSLSSSTATIVVPKNPFDEDTFFTDWVTPGLVSGLFVALVFVALVSVGISWMSFEKINFESNIFLIIGFIDVELRAMANTT